LDDDTGEAAEREGNGTYSYERKNSKLTLNFYNSSQNYETYQYNVLEFTSPRLVIERNMEYMYEKLTLVKQ